MVLVLIQANREKRKKKNENEINEKNRKKIIIIQMLVGQAKNRPDIYARYTFRVDTIKE